MIRPTLVLASSSPRRLDLLRQIGLAPHVEAAEIDEALDPSWSAAEAVEALARVKATTVAGRRRVGDAVVLGADTIVEVDGESLGKPVDPGDAIAMLHRLSGRTHHVHTGVWVASTATGEQHGAVATTAVTMRQLDQGHIAAYVATGEGLDAAGAYAIQGRAAVFVERVAGDYSNVVGLPLPLVADLLTRVGMDPTNAWQRR